MSKTKKAKTLPLALAQRFPMEVMAGSDGVTMYQSTQKSNGVWYWKKTTKKTPTVTRPVQKKTSSTSSSKQRKSMKKSPSPMKENKNKQIITNFLEELQREKEKNADVINYFISGDLPDEVMSLAKGSLDRINRLDEQMRALETSGEEDITSLCSAYMKNFSLDIGMLTMFGKGLLMNRLDTKLTSLGKLLLAKKDVISDELRSEVSGFFESADNIITNLKKKTSFSFSEAQDLSLEIDNNIAKMMKLLHRI
uniref:Uncharacterized protein n=1 Tax=viral metagenome TaxID=1070528 RepID=A0A6C0I4S3_9ZZZZ